MKDIRLHPSHVVVKKELAEAASESQLAMGLKSILLKKPKLQPHVSNVKSYNFDVKHAHPVKFVLGPEEKREYYKVEPNVMAAVANVGREKLIPKGSIFDSIPEFKPVEGRTLFDEIEEFDVAGDLLNNKTQSEQQLGKQIDKGGLFGFSMDLPNFKRQKVENDDLLDDKEPDFDDDFIEDDLEDPSSSSVTKKGKRAMERERDLKIERELSLLKNKST